MNGADLATTRLALGLSQRELARRLDIRWETWNRWERGRTVPDHPGMLRLALIALALEPEPTQKASAPTGEQPNGTRMAPGEYPKPTEEAS